MLDRDKVLHAIYTAELPGTEGGTPFAVEWLASRVGANTRIVEKLLGELEGKGYVTRTTKPHIGTMFTITKQGMAYAKTIVE